MARRSTRDPGDQVGVPHAHPGRVERNGEAFAGILRFRSQLGLPQRIGKLGFPAAPRTELPMGTLGQNNEIGPEQCCGRKCGIKQQPRCRERDERTGAEQDDGAAAEQSVGFVLYPAEEERRGNGERYREQPFRGGCEAGTPQQIARQQALDQLRLDGDPTLRVSQRGLERIP